MRNAETTVHHTATELDEREDQTDFERVRALTDEELETAIDHKDEGEFDRGTV